jgi:hypothetical protein
MDENLSGSAIFTQVVGGEVFDRRALAWVNACRKQQWAPTLPDLRCASPRPALMGRLAPCVVGEKVAVVFFHAGVAVTSRRCHKGDVALQVVIRGVSPNDIEDSTKGTELQDERVLPASRNWW